jgi:predicted O-methyltransferase YrrM
MIDFEQYLCALPMLHSWDSGATWCTGGFTKKHLEPLMAFLREHLPNPPSILETGAGNSTIAFLFLNPGRLVSIAPDAALFERIDTYCKTNGIPTERLEPFIDGSQWVLPTLALQEHNNAPRFDFALIDGDHNWPIVFVDFFYSNYMLKRGGYIMLDDVQLHAVKELARLLAEQPDYQLVLDLGKALVFRRVSESRNLSKTGPYNYLVRKSKEYAQTNNPYSL